MIKLESVHIEEVRGIRKLDLDFGKDKFAISGPNGSGKSGVIDAIEFGLTGQIGRLTGRARRACRYQSTVLTVDKTKFPDASFVTLKVFLTDIVTRYVSSPKKPKIEPDDSAVKAAFTEIAEHPEIALSRREILRFILVEPTKRSEEIQTILKLDEIGQTRSALNRAQNKLQGTNKKATALVQSARNALQLHLQIATLRADDFLEAINKRREVLGLAAIAKLAADTKLDEGLANNMKQSEFNKESALHDLKALQDTIAGFPGLAKKEALRIWMRSNLRNSIQDCALIVHLQPSSKLYPMAYGRNQESIYKAGAGVNCALQTNLSLELNSVSAVAGNNDPDQTVRHRVSVNFCSSAKVDSRNRVAINHLFRHLGP
jgi:ABC-type hemin transport system ATPase subunit